MSHLGWEFGPSGLLFHKGPNVDLGVRRSSMDRKLDEAALVASDIDFREEQEEVIVLGGKQ